MGTTTSWVTGREHTSNFAVPTGLMGRLAGRVMFWTNRQRDLLPLLGIRPGEHVLEIGYGPGKLLRLLSRTEAARVAGVDPSPEMRALATRKAPGTHPGLGTAERTGQPDAAFDCVVSVNNVAIWPELEPGLRELHRVTRPGGRVVIAWHGGATPSPLARNLRLPDDVLATLERALGDLFGDVTRHELATLTAFVSRRGSCQNSGTHRITGPRETENAWYASHPVHEPKPKDAKKRLSGNVNR
ncbi:methyltransferase domain-containing protein [Nonomuraea sp. NPDC049649]|uniref:class I SAM-dependent methyltransferase n=1 Tax=Nonomuraea sp. NPDC049649 TaxID=3155776 RepID=UPI0034377213